MFLFTSSSWTQPNCVLVPFLSDFDLKWYFLLNHICVNYVNSNTGMSSVWNKNAPDHPGHINSATGEHISSPRCLSGHVKISSEKNLEVLNLLIVM
jgi:hypothetical protein